MIKLTQLDYQYDNLTMSFDFLFSLVSLWQLWGQVVLGKVRY
ncbi:Uncharacterised protein [Providencia rettgeri]|nr:Uncharacterised protein [Providencia rettgeri]